MKMQKIKFRVWDKVNNRMMMPEKFATIRPVIDFNGNLKEGNMKLFCRHEWEYKKKPDKVVLVQCRKCGKTEFHSKNKKYIFTKIVDRTYCWCPKCNNDLVRDSFLSEKDGVVHYKCSWCGHESMWHFTKAPIPILLKND